KVEKVNYVFVAFSGEEDGLRGSKAFAEIVKSKYPNVVAMINMDMIGRLDSMKNLTVGGIGTSPIFYALMEKNKAAGMNITVDSSGVGPTDHTSFYQKGIPVLNFFTGTHIDYHKPSDDIEKINFVGEKLVLDYIFRMLTALEEVKEIPFTQTKLTSGRTSPKYKVSLGVMPDYTNYGDGLHLEAVIENRPAQKAGIEASDIITKIGSCEIKDVYSYMDCLAKLNAGDEVEVTFKRKGENKTVKVQF
ncbi:MAG: M28 family peptidase, partial [Bacteroidia bacterium]